MDKKRANILLTVLKAVMDEYPITKEFTHKAISDECFKASMSEEQVIFCKPRSKELVQKNFCFAASMLRDIVKMIATEYSYNP